MKRIILIFILVLIILMLPTQVFAENEEIMTSTQEKFNISGFLKEAQKFYFKNNFKQVESLPEKMHYADDDDFFVKKVDRG